jgi:heptosyltransferase-2
VADPCFVGFQLKNIGDALMCLPAFGLIKEGIPGARTALVVRPPAAPLLEGSPLVDKLFVADHGHGGLGIGGTFRLASELGLFGCEAAFGFDHKGRSGFLSLIAGHKRRYASFIPGYERPSWPWRDLIPEPDWAGPNPLMGTHMAVCQAALAAKALGLDYDYSLKESWLPTLPPPGEGELEDASSLLGLERPRRGPVIGLCLRGRQPEKSWPLGYFAAVLEGLKDSHGAEFCVTGAQEDSRAAQALKGLAKAEVSDLCGKTTLLGLAALLTKLDLFITVDTGSAHLAALAGCPMVAIYTASNPLQWAPFNSKGMRLLCYDLVKDRFGIAGLLPKEGIGFHPYVSPGDVLRSAAELLGGG